VEHLPDGIDRLLAEVEASRRVEKGRRKDDLSLVAERLFGDPGNTEKAGSVTVICARVDFDRAELMELSRLLSKGPDRVVLLASEREGRGTLFIGSTAPSIPAQELLKLALPAFQGKGGGNPASATAVGEPGPPLESALELARAEARRRAAVRPN
jgi:alanyl-tRNA synthetase